MASGCTARRSRLDKVSTCPEHTNWICFASPSPIMVKNRSKLCHGPLLADPDSRRVHCCLRSDRPASGICDHRHTWISSTPIATIGPSCRCSSPHCTTYSTDWQTLCPRCCKTTVLSPLPGQLPRPVRQEQHVGLGQLVFADPPGDRFDAYSRRLGNRPGACNKATRPCSPKQAQTRTDARPDDHDSPALVYDSLSTPVFEPRRGRTVDLDGLALGAVSRLVVNAETGKVLVVVQQGDQPHDKTPKRSAQKHDRRPGIEPPDADPLHGLLVRTSSSGARSWS